jgi:xanthine dehydrogenase accessory factor
MSLYGEFRRLLKAEAPVAIATLVSGETGVGAKMLVTGDGARQGSLGTENLDAEIAQRATALLREERSATVEVEQGSSNVEVFIDVFPAPPRLIIVGASHAAVPLSSFARSAGYHVTVCDARAAFAVPERFPDANQVLKGWPQDLLPSLPLTANTFVVLLSHDPRFDEPTLEITLPSDVRYIGAIGSRRTQKARFDRLRAAGFTEQQLARVYGPVGLDIGGRSPEETAIAILAELTAVRYGHSGGFLRDRKR